MTIVPSPLALKEICLGRQLISIPAELSLGGDVTLIYGLDKSFTSVQVEVLNEKGGDAALKAAVASTSAELTARFDAKTPSKNRLAAEERIDDNTVYVLEHSEPTMRGYYRVVVLARVGEAAARFSSDVYPRDKPEDIRSRVLRVVARTRFAGSASVEGPGTCLGPLVIDAGQDGERFSVGGRGTTHPEMSLSISINSLLAESDGSLLERVDRKAGVLAQLGVTGRPMRRGKVLIADRAAEELVDEEEAKGKVVRLFVAETVLTEPSTFARPRLHIEMEFGGSPKNGDKPSAHINPSLGPDDSLAVWDAMIRSIRLRPGSV